MSKLITASQDLSICLHCQYRLSLRQRLRHGRRRTTNHPQHLRWFTAGTSLQQQPSAVPDAATNVARLPIRYLTEELHPGQIYRHRSGSSRKDSLGLNVLGKPAEVLVLQHKEESFLNDKVMAKVRVSGPDKNPAPEPITSSEMLEKMDAERGVIDIDEACKNIDNLRASLRERVNTGDTYKDLFSKLQLGFTKPQLLAYLDSAGKAPPAGTFDLNVRFSNNTYARSTWQSSEKKPSQQSRAPRIGSPGKEIIVNESSKNSSKRALVKKILRQRWNLRAELQASAVGQLDMRLRKPDLDLILKHKRDILKLLSRSYDSKVETWPQQSVIRITSDYVNCVDIVRVLVHTVENIKQSKIRLDVNPTPRQSSAPPGQLDTTIIKQVEEYSNTRIIPSGKAFRVWYLGPDDADLVETQRLIHQMLRPPSTQVSELAWSDSNKPADASPVPAVVGSRLSMLNRNQEWSRWCSPHISDQAKEKKRKDGSPPSTSSADSAVLAMHGESAFHAVKSFFGRPINNSCRRETPYWASDAEFHDSVTLGQVLFPAEMAQSVAKGLKSEKQQMKMKGLVSKPIETYRFANRSLKQPRQFMPLVAGLVQFLDSVESLEKSEEYLQVRLSPSPKSMSLPITVQTLPDLEIRIFLNHEHNRASIEHVCLVYRVVKDFLQPQNIVDLRFGREQRFYANVKQDMIDPCITAFVQNSNLNIWGTERLKTPLGLSLSIPPHAVQFRQGFDPKLHDTVNVDYTSLGLEHRSSLTIPYKEADSWPTLTYTNIEAGRIGGRRDELSLHNLRFASDHLATADPDPLAVNTERTTLSDDDHASILFQKTGALIESIEQSSQGSRDKPSLQMPESKRLKLYHVDVSVDR